MICQYDYASHFTVEEIYSMKGQIYRHLQNPQNVLDPNRFPRYQTKTTFLNDRTTGVWEKVHATWQDAMTKYRGKVDDITYIKSWALMIPPGFDPQYKPWHYHKHDKDGLEKITETPVATTVFYLDALSGTDIKLEGERYGNSDIEVTTIPKIGTWLIMPNDVLHRPSNQPHVTENRYTIVVDAYVK